MTPIGVSTGVKPVIACPGPLRTGSHWMPSSNVILARASGSSRRTATFSASTNAMPNTSRRLEYQTDRRKRTVLANAGKRMLEDVALSANGLNEFITEAFIPLAPEVVHVDLHRLGEGVGVLVPDVFEQLFLGDGPPLIPRQVVEQREFLRRQMDLAALAARPVGVRVQFQSARVEDRFPEAAFAPGDGPDPGRQLAEGEGLHEIVVGALGQPFDTLANRTPGGQHDDSAAEAVFAEALG